MYTHARSSPGSHPRQDEEGGSGHRSEPEGPALSRSRTPRNAGRICPRLGRLQSVCALCVVGAVLLLQAPAASAYLVKSHLYWERVGAFPHYLTTTAGAAGSWPKSQLCYNGPDCGKNTPEYQCNSDCGNPNIGLKDKNKYPKAFLIRFVSWHLAAHNWLAVPRLVQSLMPNCSMCFCRMCFCGQVIDVVVDIRMWADVFNAIKPTLNSITQIGTFCRDLAMPLDAPDNCEAELPFFVMNITNEGQEGYVYMQHTSMWDYSRGSGAGK